MFFSSHDLFADYIKVVASYPGQAAVQLEAWLPTQWDRIIKAYLPSNFGSDPSLIHEQLTHFGLPPLSQLFYVFSRHLAGSVGAMTAFVGSVAAGLLWLFWCICQSLQGWRDRLLFLASVVLVYPSLFLLTRGNLASLFSSLAVSSAFLLAIQPKKSAALSVIMLSLAVGFRPNNVVYLPLLLLIAGQMRSDVGTWRSRVVIGFAIFGTLLLSFCLLLHWVYPAFTIKRFLDSYRWIAQHYDTSTDNVAFVSSPLQITHLGIRRALGPLLAQSALPFVKALLLLGGLGICLFALLLRWRDKVSISSAILISTAGMILATPWFADYHLLILIAPLLCWAAIEKNAPVPEPSEVRSSALIGRPPELLRTRCSSAGQSGGTLTRLDCITVFLLLLPKPFALSASVPNAGALFNPIVVAVYAGFVILRHRASITPGVDRRPA
jgi:hypothetical protein